MKRLLWVTQSLLILALLAACGSAAGEGGQMSVAQSDKARNASPSLKPGELDQLTAGNRAFAFDFYQQMRDQTGNLFFSPHSISVALSMTSAGARGTTAEQIAKALHFDLPATSLHPAFNALQLALAEREKDKNDPKQTNFKLSVVNSLWGQNGYKFLADYLDLLAQNYGAGMRLLDFKTAPQASRKVINDWVAQQTADKIQNLLPETAVTPDTRLVLANAIYFNAQWLHQFTESSTKAGSFTLLDGSKINVPMMNISETFGYYQGGGISAVELPYTGGQVSMVLLVPDAGQFAAVEKTLGAGQWDTIRKSLQFGRVNLSMPKFKFTQEVNLVDPLKKLGLLDAFDPNKADLSGMDGTRSLYVSSAVHKAYINLDEKGTEAAAATGISIGLTSMPAEPVNLTVDRPFLFLIQDKPTGEILFLGRVTNPAQ